MMRKIKRVAALVLAAVVVFVSGQFLGTTKVEAAGGIQLTMLNAQATSTPSVVQQQLAYEGLDASYVEGSYIVSDATFIKLKYVTIGGENEIFPYTINGGLSEYGYEMSSGSGTYRFSSIKELAGAYADGYLLFYGTENDYKIVVLVPQSKAGVNGLSAAGTKTDDSTCAMNRLYNPNSGEHFYTANAAEKNYLVSIGWNDEGLGWTAPPCSGTPVYRVYNPNAGDHHYTTDAAERNYLIATGWNDEGIGWYSDEAQSSVLYRMYNPNCTGAGSHHYTTNYEEAKNLRNLGWRYEGRAWYGL